MSRLGTFGGRLYRGEVSFDFVGRQKLWYTISGLILLLSLVGLFGRGLNFTVDFKGGSVIQFPATSASSISQVQRAVSGTGDGQGAIVQHVGSGSSATWQVQTGKLDYAQGQQVQSTLSKELGIPQSQISVNFVGASWGSQISQKALQALIAFLIVIVIYLSIAFEWRMAVAALIALVARHRDHRGRVRAGRLPGRPRHRDRAADHPRLLALRHRGRLRQGPGEYRRPARVGPQHLQPGRQPGPQPDPGPVHQHLGDRAAAGGRDLVHRRRAAGRRGAERPGPGAVHRHAVRHLLLHLHRHPGARGPQGTRPPVQGAGQAGGPAGLGHPRRPARRREGAQRRRGRCGRRGGRGCGRAGHRRRGPLRRGRSRARIRPTATATPRRAARTRSRRDGRPARPPAAVPGRGSSRAGTPPRPSAAPAARRSGVR